MVADDEHWPDGHVPTWRHAEQVDERGSALHGQPKPDIVPVLRVRAPITVTEEAVSPEVVVVGPSLALDHRLGHDAERHLGQDCGLEDPLRPQERHALAFELESARQRREREHLAVKRRLLAQELERTGPNTRVEVPLSHADYPRYTASACHSRNSRLGWSSSRPGNQIRFPENDRYGSPLSKSVFSRRLTRKRCSGVTVT